MLALEAIDGDIGPFEFRMSSTIAWVTDSTLAIINRDDQEILIVTTAGDVVGRFGRKGSGPGEFTDAFAMWVGVSGDILVGDAMAMRVSRFDRDLEFQQSANVPGRPWHFLDWRDGRAVLMWLPMMPVAGPTVGVVDLRAGSVVSSFSVFESDQGLAIPLPGAPLQIPDPHIAAAALRPGHYAFASPQRYRIVVMDDAGTVLTTSERPEVEREMPSAEEVQALEESIRRQAATLSPAPSPEQLQMMLDMARVPKPYFRPTAFTADDQGRLWLATDRGDPQSTEIDVLDADGRYLTTLEVPHEVRGMSIRLPRLAVFVERKHGSLEGEHGIDLYEVTAVPEGGDTE